MTEVVLNQSMNSVAINITLCRITPNLSSHSQRHDKYLFLILFLDVALIVFNKSIKFSHHLRNDDPNYKAVLFFEFLDDTFADWENEGDTLSLSDDYDTISVGPKYQSDNLLIKRKLEEKRNHPLAVMVTIVLIIIVWCSPKKCSVLFLCFLCNYFVFL